MRKVIFYFIPAIFLVSCFHGDEVYFEDGEILGYKPIYATTEDYEIIFQEPKALKNPGKIYYYNKFIFINELFEGVHLYNNIDPENPQNIGFIKIKGNVDIAIRNNVLYADNIRDLISIDISDPKNIIVLDRINDVIPSQSLYPLEQGVYFECPDPGKGTIVGWEKTVLVDPKCQR